MPKAALKKKMIKVEAPHTKKGFYYREQMVGEEEQGSGKPHSSPFEPKKGSSFAVSKKWAGLMLGATALGAAIALGTGKREQQNALQVYKNLAGEHQGPSGKEPKWNEVLNVDENASPDDIKKAYRDLAKKLHPDVNKDPDSVAKMQEVNKAFDRSGTKGSRSRKGKPRLPKQDSFFWSSPVTEYDRGMQEAFTSRIR